VSFLTTRSAVAAGVIAAYTPTDARSSAENERVTATRTACHFFVRKFATVGMNVSYALWDLGKRRREHATPLGFLHHWGGNVSKGMAGSKDSLPFFSMT
jgi:hypothetical protein